MVAVRDYLREQRHALDKAAAARYPDLARVADTTLLTAPNWVPSRPFPLTDVELVFEPERPFRPVTDSASSSILPTRPDGTKYAGYSHALGEIAAPSVFENRPTYRLLDADLSGPRGRMVFGRGKYFDGIDTGEAAAHEFAARQFDSEVPSTLRDSIGNPCDLTRRPANLAISTLTIQRDRTSGESTFYLHWRDPAKVGHAGGLYQVVPVGIFQPAGDGPGNEMNDFSLWRNMMREFAEELGGEPEIGSVDDGVVDYDDWQFARTMSEGLQSGRVSAYCLGLGVDPLTFATDLLTATVIDADLFDTLFGREPTGNAEGRITTISASEQDTLLPADGSRQMQAAGEAIVRLALHNSELYSLAHPS